MMIRINHILVFLVVAGIVFSCAKKNDPSLDDLGYNYYPIRIGDYFIYDVIDTSFQGLGSEIVSTYQVKEEIHETVVVNDEERYQIYLYYKQPNEEWKEYPDSNWTVFLKEGKLIRIEDNIRFVKLVFPLSVNKKWDGNITDTESDPQNYYTMKEINRPFSYDAQNFNETVSVVHYENSSALDDNYSVEVFAKNVGMVYKEIKVYKYEQSNLLAKQIEYGRHYYKKLVSYGRTE